MLGFIKMIADGFNRFDSESRQRVCKLLMYKADALQESIERGGAPRAVGGLFGGIERPGEVIEDVQHGKRDVSLATTSRLAHIVIGASAVILKVGRGALELVLKSLRLGMRSLKACGDRVRCRRFVPRLRLGCWLWGGLRAGLRGRIAEGNLVLQAFDLVSERLDLGLAFGKFVNGCKRSLSGVIIHKLGDLAASLVGIVSGAVRRVALSHMGDQLLVSESSVAANSTSATACA